LVASASLALSVGADEVVRRVTICQAPEPLALDG
jgi:hypothetical protein